MKLHWFSPLPPARTDIAHYTTRVLPALTARADVTLWTDQLKWDTDLDKCADVRSYRPDRMSWEDLNRDDMCIYHIGNNPAFHGAIWQVARRHSGLVVLHDSRLHHFFDGLYREQWRDLRSYLEVMGSYYGEAGRLDAEECFRTDARNIDYMAENYPLTEFALENALGVVVHTREAFDSLRQQCALPVNYSPLPFAPAQSPPILGPQDPGRTPYRLILFGYIGRNRRLNAVLEALAGLPERDKFHLDVYGEILGQSQNVRRQIASLGLKKHVTLHGFKPEAELNAALSRAHLAINLRFPTMGEASGSQLRIWAHGLPSLVTKVGWYASLPTGSAAFVRPDDNEIPDIKKHLHAFLASPGNFALMGKRGREVLEEDHAPAVYAQSIIDFVAKAQAFRSFAASYKLASRSGAEIARWDLPRLSDRINRRVAAEIHELAGSSDLTYLSWPAVSRWIHRRMSSESSHRLFMYKKLAGRAIRKCRRIYARSVKKFRPTR